MDAVKNRDTGGQEGKEKVKEKKQTSEQPLRKEDEEMKEENFSFLCRTV